MLSVRKGDPREETKTCDRQGQQSRVRERKKITVTAASAAVDVLSTPAAATIVVTSRTNVTAITDLSEIIAKTDTLSSRIINFICITSGVSQTRLG